METEIKKRLVELRNLKALHIRAKKRIVFLEQENRQLRTRIKELEKRDKDKGEKIEAMSFQLEQIKIKLFGKKPIAHTITQKKEKKNRDIFSYQRPIPKNFTKIEPHPINECVHCHGELKKTSRYLSKKLLSSMKWKLDIAILAKDDQADVIFHPRSRYSEKILKNMSVSFQSGADFHILKYRSI